MTKGKKRLIIIIIVAAVLGIAAGITAGVLFSVGSDFCEYYADREIADESKITYVEIKVEGYSDSIIVLLDASVAPKTVKNFVSLASTGFYDGLTFHRIIEDFMIQGGDDSHLPKEEQADTITGEFLINGYWNDLEHKRGVISMARATDYDSASSGFFICDADSPHLDGAYASFGYVVKGLRTVDRIVNRTRFFTGYNGQITDKNRQPVIEYIKVLDSYEAN